MAFYTKSVNETEGANRMRFESLSERLRKVHVDIIHRVVPSVHGDGDKVSPRKGDNGSFFQDQLEQCKELDVTSHFRRFQWKTAKLVHSLAELIHHQSVVIDNLIEALVSAPVDEVGSYLSLVAALGQDLQDDLFANFHKLFKAIVVLIDRTCTQTPSPELAGKVFECFSYLLKHQMKTFIKNPDSLRQYYGQLLSHSSKTARDFSAKSLSIIIRKLSPQLFKTHLRKVVKSLALAMSSSYNFEALTIPRFHSFQSDQIYEENNLSPKLRNSIDGVSLLLFASIKGVRGFLHSHGGMKLKIILSGISQISCITDSNQEGFNPLNRMYTFLSGRIVGHLLTRLLRHIHPKQALDVWHPILEAFGDLLKNYKEDNDNLSTESKQYFGESSLISLLNMVETVLYGLTQGNGRTLHDPNVKSGISKSIIAKSLDLCVLVLEEGKTFDKIARSNPKLVCQLQQRTCELYSHVWSIYPTSKQIQNKSNQIIELMISSANIINNANIVDVFNNLLGSLPLDVVATKFLHFALRKIIEHVQSISVDDQTVYLHLLLAMFYKMHDHRPNGGYSDGVTSTAAIDNEDNESNENDWEYGDNESSDSDSSDRESSSSPPRHTPRYSQLQRDQLDTYDLISVLSQSSSSISYTLRFGLEYLSNIFVTKKNATNLRDTFSNHDNHSTNIYLTSKILQWIVSHISESIKNEEIQTLIKSFVSKFDSYMKLCKDSRKFLYSQDQGANKELLNTTDHLIIDIMTLVNTLRMQIEDSKSDKPRDVILEHFKLLIFAVRRNPYSIAMTAHLLQHLDIYLNCSHVEASTFEWNSILSESESNQLLSAIGGAFSTPSQWLRRNLLNIFRHFPVPVIDPIDSDIKSQPGDTNKDKKPYLVDVASLCIEAMSLDISLNNERDFSRIFGSIEVIVRNGRLPILYTRAICGICLGIFHIKFKPFWDAASSVLVAALNAYEKNDDDLWSILVDNITTVGSIPIEASGNSHHVVSPIKNQDPDSSLSQLSEILSLDYGSNPLSISTASSCLFYYNITSLGPSSSKLSLVQPDSRTDTQTVYSSLWNILKRCPNITLKRSKVIIPIFLQFLSQHYYKYFKDDIDYPLMMKLGVISYDNHESINEPYRVLSPSILKKRLTMFLEVLSQVTSPKQLYQHNLLFHFYLNLIGRSETEIVKHSMACLLTYKPDYLMPYKDSITRLLNDRTIKEELLSLNLSMNSDGSIDPRHRDDFIPFLIRLVYGKMVSSSNESKSSRDQALARRSAILSFFNGLPPNEMIHLSQLIYRGLIPKQYLMNIDINLSPSYVDKMHKQSLTHDSTTITLTSYYKPWYEAISQIIDNLQPEAFSTIPWDRQIGYLFSVEKIVKIIGLGMSSQISQQITLVTSLMRYANSVKATAHNHMEIIEDVNVHEQDNEEEEELLDDMVMQGSNKRDMTMASKVRTMCLLRLAEMVHQYNTTYSFEKIMTQDVFEPILPLIQILPQSMKSKRSPALLKLIDSLIQYDKTIPVIAQSKDICVSLIQCISFTGTEQETSKIIITCLYRLLHHQNGKTILPYAQLIIESFTQRFLRIAKMSEDLQVFELKISELKISPTGSIKQELSLLCEIAEGIFQHSTICLSQLSLKNLATLLLGMLRTYTIKRKIRVEVDWMKDILRIYKSLISRIDDISTHIPFISRLFGPASHSTSLFNHYAVRLMLVDVYEALSHHKSSKNLLVPSLNALKALLAYDPNILDCRDFDRCMPVFQGLADAISFEHQREVNYSWRKLLRPTGMTNIRDSSICTAVIFECFRCLYDQELIIRSAALSALKNLISLHIEWIQHDSTASSRDDETILLRDLLSSLFIPLLRTGLKLSNDVIKKGFIQLLSYMIQTLSATRYHANDSMAKILQNSSDYHCDLVFLLNDDPEQDFFENICHIQLHRRIRAMGKLKVSLVQLSQQENDDNMIHQSSFVHVLLPLAFQPLVSEEYIKKDHLPYMQESASFLGAISKNLSWSHYYYTIKGVLRHLERFNEEKENVLITALCSILDSFHFPLVEAIDKPIEQSNENDEAELEANDENDDEDENKRENSEDIALNDEAVDIEGDSDESIPMRPTSMGRILLRSILPWVKLFLLKDVKDQKGEKTKQIRPQIAVALTKIVKQLQPPIIISQSEKDTMFRSLIITIINTLRSRDNSVRDIARSCLVKIASTMGLQHSFYLIIHELTTLLTEGYQRHVCSYTVRYLLNQLFESYDPPTDIKAPAFDAIEADVDRTDMKKGIMDECIDILMEIVTDDLTGISQEDRDVETANRSLIREAKGIKAYDILEICSKKILFRPTYALIDLSQAKKYSSIHAMSMPLMDLLTQNHENKAIIHRISEALNHVAIGLTMNPSIIAEELLLYLHATLHPFVITIIKQNKRHQQAMGYLKVTGSLPSNEIFDINDEDIDEDIYNDLPSYLQEESSDEDEKALYSKKTSKKSRKNNDVVGFKPSTWLPNDSKYLSTQKSVVQARDSENKALYLVQDGASAPRLTGNNRSIQSSKSTTQECIIDPATIEAVKFCLLLFHSSIKKDILQESNQAIHHLISSFLPLLSHCLRLPNASDVIALAMKCICHILSWENLAIDMKYSQVIGNFILKLMFRGGVIISSDNELVQACMKGLVSLFQNYNRYKKFQPKDIEKDYNKPMNFIDEELFMDKKKRKAKDTSNAMTLPLSESKIRLLLQLLNTSILEITSNYQNTAFQLIKTILETKIMLPEIYDLMKTLFEQLVLSQRKGIRDLSSSTIIHFIIHYPIGNKRFVSHFNQLIANCSYEYHEGRLSALSTILALIKVLPTDPILHDHCQYIFLSMTTRLVNDESIDCRQVISEILSTLFRRINIDQMHILYEYTMKWFHTNLFDESKDLSQCIKSKGLIRTGTQIFNILITSRNELFKRSSSLNDCVAIIRNNLLLLLTSSGNISYQNQGNNNLNNVELIYSSNIEGDGDSGGIQSWAIIYHLLILFENLLIHMSSATERVIYVMPSISADIVDYIHKYHGVAIDSNYHHIMNLIQEAMVYPHIWIRSTACRILKLSLSRRDYQTLSMIHHKSSNTQSNSSDNRLSMESNPKDYLTQTNALYQLSRRYCIVLNQPYLVDNLFDSVCVGLIFVIQAMYHNPHLCTTNHSVHDINDEDDEKEGLEDQDREDEDGDKEISDKEMDSKEEEGSGDDSIASESNENGNKSEELQLSGANWVMQRLRNIGSDKRGLRRLYAIKIFQRLVDVECLDFVMSHSRQLIEVCIRNEMTTTSPKPEELELIKEESRMLLESLEKKIGTSHFLGVYTEMQRHLQSKRAEKKRLNAINAIVNPTEFSNRKISRRKREPETKRSSLQSMAVRIIDDKKKSKSKRHIQGKKRKSESQGISSKRQRR